MDAMPVYVAFAIATLLIVLGFIALLTQKVYLDGSTQQPPSRRKPASHPGWCAIRDQAARTPSRQTAEGAHRTLPYTTA